MSRYVAVYDVTEDRNRTRIARILGRYGDRLQRSVYELWLDPDDVIAVRRLVGPNLAKSDRFEMIPIDLAPHRKRWRWGPENDSYEPVVLLGD